MPGLAVVRSLHSPRRLVTPAELEDFEEELLDQWLLARAAAGVTDAHLLQDRSSVIQFLRYTGKPVWMNGPAEADRWLTHLRQIGRSHTTVKDKAWALGRFYAFLVLRYQGDIHALTGAVVQQPIDEFNRPHKSEYGVARIPPSNEEIETLFTPWREWLPDARKYLPAARDYMAASLWRRVGLRLNETVMLDIRDWRPDLGSSGKLHVRFGKGSMGRGPKGRLIPCINGVDALLTWWLTDVRHQYGDDWSNPDAPLFPSERRDRHSGEVVRVGGDALRTGLDRAVERWLPDWHAETHKLTPHVLRHYCASSLYEQGVGLKAIQELLGHSWLATTTIYVHVHEDHVEQAWKQANQRVTARLIRG
ncbi:tyrosine-type recombinase/integrase [Luteococcus sp.]|uniref:tyrosine-type recombinase/integrase n=1 Tax=Luteococcus sp. TaxID=1969402 RepID=UPI0037352D9B